MWKKDNKEAAHLKKINHYPSTVEGGGFINQFPTLPVYISSFSNVVYLVHFTTLEVLFVSPIPTVPWNVFLPKVGLPAATPRHWII